MITIYGIKNCDSVKKALKWLDEVDIKYQFHDYKKAGIDEADLQDFIREFGLEVVINKRGTSWKKLSDKQQQDAQNVSLAIELIKENTSLIKRPIIKKGATYLIGFNEEDYRQKIL